jgi:hypothetical protein
MSDYQLTHDVHIIPTPLGAYSAISNPQPDAARSLILGILASETTQKVSIETLRQYAGDTDPLRLLYWMEKANWIVGRAESETLATQHIETDVPYLLSQLSSDGKALLADHQGFYLVNAGFTRELAEELAILAAEISTIQSKHSELIRNKLRLGSLAMGVIDSGGNSELGCWPLFIGKHHFMLVISGIHRFDQQAYLHLIWALCRRYNNDVLIE